MCSFSWVSGSGTAGSQGRCTFKVIRNCQRVFQSGYLSYTVISGKWELQLLHILINIWFFHFELFQGCKVLSPYSFNLYFPHAGDIELHFLCFLATYFLFCSVCSRFLSILKTEFIISLLTCRVLNIFWISSLLHIHTVNIFSQCLACLILK